MTIPIYSNLKAKLEAKGLDARTSGQIAWFVCSVAIAHIIFMCLFIYNVSIDHIEDIIKAIIYVYLNHFFLFGFMWFVLLLNLFYKTNSIPLILSIITTMIYFYSKYSAYIFLAVVLIGLYKYKKRFFYTCIVGICYTISIYYMFQLRGGFYK